MSKAQLVKEIQSELESVRKNFDSKLSEIKSKYLNNPGGIITCIDKETREIFFYIDISEIKI